MAGSKSRTMHGARAILHIAGKKIGIFNQVSYGVNLNVQPVDILGRYNPAEVVITHQEAITVACQGWRIINAGPVSAGKFPTLSDLLNHEDIFLSIEDRRTGETIAKVDNVRPVSFQTSLNSRGLQELTITFMGTVFEDEDGGGADATAMDLP